MKMNFKEDILKGNVDATVLMNTKKYMSFYVNIENLMFLLKDIEEFQKLLDSIEE